MTRSSSKSAGSRDNKMSGQRMDMRPE
jgi:hypothetical protein